jgi:hypothetical protein
MLSAVLRSPRAIQVSIEIIRTVARTGASHAVRCGSRWA